MKKGLRVAALLGLLSGCTTTPPTIGDPAPQLTDRRAEQEYQDIFEKYSDRAEIYDGFDTRMFAGATFQSLAFREARVRRQGAFQILPKQRLEELLAQERTEEAQYNDFHLGVHVNDYRFEDFANRKRSIWRIVLLTPADEAAAVAFLDLHRERMRNRVAPAVLFLLCDGSGERRLREAYALASWLRGREYDPTRAPEVDAAATRETFTERTGSTPEAWLAAWRSGELADTLEHNLLAQEALLLEGSGEPS